ncbi:MAG: hypothetical protein CMK03_12380 [Ponticaulis sp.]|nr:hypothetical protein [Ponticaulis sp.]
MIEKYTDEIFEEKDWLRKLLSKSEQQLSGLYGIREKERFKTMFSLLSLSLSSLLFALTLFLIVHPSGSMLVNPEFYQFMGALCVFLGYFLYQSYSRFYEHRAILRQVSEGIHQQRIAIDRATEALYHSEEKLSEKNN